MPDACPRLRCTRPIRSRGLCKTHAEAERQAVARAAAGPSWPPVHALTATLAAFLAELPDLPRAACRTNPGAFEPLHPGESIDRRDARHLRAIATCTGCPALAPCDRAAEQLRDVGLTGFVVAGRVLRP